MPNILPPNDIFAAPRTQLCVNEAWISWVMGAIARLEQQGRWTGTDAEVRNILQQVLRLQEALGGGPDNPCAVGELIAEADFTAGQQSWSIRGNRGTYVPGVGFESVQSGSNHQLFLQNDIFSFVEVVEVTYDFEADLTNQLRLQALPANVVYTINSVLTGENRVDILRLNNLADTIIIFGTAGSEQGSLVSPIVRIKRIRVFGTV